MARRPSGWAKVDWKKTEKGIQRVLISDLSKKEEAEFVKIFIELQDSFVRDLPSQETPTMPLITGNLHDSIVGVTSNNGHVVKASYPKPVATTSSEVTGKKVYKSTSGMGRKKIIGSLAAQTLVRNMNGRYPTGVASSLFVGVPYALRPQMQGPHAGYLDVLRDNFAWMLNSEFRAAEGRGLLKIKGINLDQYVELLYEPDDMRIFTEPKKRGRPKGSGQRMGGNYGTGMGMKMMP